MKIYRLASSVNGKEKFAVLRPSNTQNIKEVDVLDVGGTIGVVEATK